MPCPLLGDMMDREFCDSHLHIRITSAQEQRWHKAAKHKGKRFSLYVRSTLDTAADTDLDGVVEEQEVH